MTRKMLVLSFLISLLTAGCAARTAAVQTSTTTSAIKKECVGQSRTNQNCL